MHSKSTIPAQIMHIRIYELPAEIPAQVYGAAFTQHKHHLDNCTFIVSKKTETSRLDTNEEYKKILHLSGAGK
jgi:hypothetical protein